MAIETSDVMFAFDSVPAVIAVTQEPLLIYAAMIFAILGLRSLYFVLAALTKYLVHLGKALPCCSLLRRSWPCRAGTMLSVTPAFIFRPMLA